MHPLAHFKTITEHRLLVQKYCFRLGLVWQGLTHDLSKYAPTEFWRGARYYQGDRSPNDAERKDTGISLAWLHHKGRNRHHFEYWTDYSTVTKRLEPVRMPDQYLFEMFCDRVAASKIYMGENYTDSSPLNYFLRAKHDRIIEKNTAARLEYLLRMLADKGEDYTFRFIRKQVRKGRGK